MKVCLINELSIRSWHVVNNSTVYFQLGQIFLARTLFTSDSIGWHEVKGETFVKIANYYPDCRELYLDKLLTEEIQKFIEAYEIINQ